MWRVAGGAGEGSVRLAPWGSPSHTQTALEEGKARWARTRGEKV